MSASAEKNSSPRAAGSRRQTREDSVRDGELSQMSVRGHRLTDTFDGTGRRRCVCKSRRERVQIASRRIDGKRSCGRSKVRARAPRCCQCHRKLIVSARRTSTEVKIVQATRFESHRERAQRSMRETARRRGGGGRARQRVAVRAGKRDLERYGGA